MKTQQSRDRGHGFALLILRGYFDAIGLPQQMRGCASAQPHALSMTTCIPHTPQTILGFFAIFFFAAGFFAAGFFAAAFFAAGFFVAIIILLCS
jgi:hypothetical protein